MDDLGTKLKSLRRKLRLTQQEMAEKIGVARSTYALYEINKIKPSLEVYDRIVSLTGQPQSKLFDVAEYNNEYKIKRIANGWTQADLSELTGIRESAIDEIEAGNRLPTADEFMKMAGVFGDELSLMFPYSEAEKILYLGTPETDRNKLKLMTNNRIEYVKEMIKSILLSNGYTFNIVDNRIRILINGSYVDLTQVELFELFEVMQRYLKESQSNFLKFKLNEIKQNKGL